MGVLWFKFAEAYFVNRQRKTCLQSSSPLKWARFHKNSLYQDPLYKKHWKASNTLLKKVIQSISCRGFKIEILEAEDLFRTQLYLEELSSLIKMCPRCHNTAGSTRVREYGLASFWIGLEYRHLKIWGSSFIDKPSEGFAPNQHRYIASHIILLYQVA